MTQLSKSPIRIILADDHAVVRAGIRTFLERSGQVQVLAEASDGQQALHMITELHPDVVVLDIQMPVMNGIEATRAIRARQMPVGILILTAYDDHPYVNALLRAGANGYLLKTAAPEEIIQAVQEVFQGKKVIDRLLAEADAPHDDLAADIALSDREMEVLRQAAAGWTNKAIANQLQISPKTVQNHLSNIFTKMQVESRTEMVTTAIRLGWLKPDSSPLPPIGVAE